MTIKGVIPSTEEVDFIDSVSGRTSIVLRAFGTRINVSNTTNGDDIWIGTATTLPIPPDAGEQMTIVSTSAQDGAGGTGVLTLMVHYIDASGVANTETVTMNGIGGVNTTATNIRFVQEIHSVTTGTNLLAVGTITIYTFGNAANIYTQIQPGTNQSLCTARMVPAGKLLIITGFHASGGASAGGKSADLRLRATSHELLLTPRIFHFIDNLLAFNSQTSRNYTQPIIIPALGIVKVTSYATVGGADVQASWEGVLIPIPT